MSLYSYIVFNFVYYIQSNVKLFDSHLDYSQQSPLKGESLFFFIWYIFLQVICFYIFFHMWVMIIVIERLWFYMIIWHWFYTYKTFDTIFTPKPKSSKNNCYYQENLLILKYETKGELYFPLFPTCDYREKITFKSKRPMKWILKLESKLLNYYY